MKTFKIICSGKVQGVFFRKYTLQKASQLRLTGTVRNLQDGTVEILVRGESHALDSLLTWCETGSPLSQVTSVSSKVIDGVALPWPFEIAY